MYFSYKKLILITLILIVLIIYLKMDEPFLEGNSRRMLNSSLRIIWGLTVLTVIFVLIMENRSPSKTLSWILILFFLPVAGIILYLVFGRNFRKKRIYTRKEFSDYEKLRQINKIEDEGLLGDKVDPGTDLKRNYDASGPATVLINRLLENNNKAFLSYHNRIHIYRDGKEVFAELCESIDRAVKSIHLQFFVVKGDETGQILKRLLIKKAQSGVSVRLLYDAVGSWNIGKRFVKDLIAGGVNAVPFSPVEFPFISSKMNYRNHRKIAVIDGKTGFLGGVNIADRYLHKDKYFGYWRDTHLKIEGEAVSPLQAIFLNDWSFATDEDLFRKEFFSPQEVESINPLQIISSGPDSDWESIMQGYFAMISTAAENINIVSPYLVLNESMLTAVKVSALSGVRVRLIVPCKPDHHLVYWASRSYYQELMEAGVEIYEYRKGFIHSKYITVDGYLASIGSANMDIRSFTQNMEVNAFLFSKDLTEKLNEIFEEDLQNSEQIILEEYHNRGYYIRIKESFNRLFSPVL